MRSPLFVFPSRQFSQPHLRHEERLSFCVRLPSGDGRAGAPRTPPTRNEDTPDSLTVKHQQGLGSELCQFEK
jgi:hypothetical protein